MAPSPVRLEYGPKKYAALHLMLCRWIRLHGTPGASYCYVTLGGTELRDIESLRFVDIKLTTNVWSYEEKHDRHQLAGKNAAKLIAGGMTLDVVHSSIFSHKRTSDLPHIFFLDILGICAWGDYHQLFAGMFQNEIIREGDCLLITSHLGHRPGLDDVRKHFGGEFSVLGIDENDKKLVRGIYRRAHPTMTLFKALSLNGIQSELSMRCFGAVKYRDGAPMGIYGYTINAGKTDLATFVNDNETAYFDISTGRHCIREEF
jgi:hypothetical protein